MLPCPPSSCVRFTVHAHVLPTAKRMEPVGEVWMSNAPASIYRVQESLKLPAPITKVWASSLADGSFEREPAAGTEEGSDDNPHALIQCVAHAAKGAPSLLALSIYEAFYEHHPLKLNANVIWVTIAQGFARHIAADPEAFRTKFVTHKGSKLLEVIDPRASGPASVNWPAAFSGFADQIGKHVGLPTLALFSNAFSNSTPNDVVASQITLMDAMQHYFHYGLRGGCGIPYIELEGTVADWVALRAKGEALRAFDVGAVTMKSSDGKLMRTAFFETATVHLGGWLDALLPVLDKLVEAARGAPDATFFGAVCNASGGSYGVGKPITGWATVFYPFDQKGGPSRAFSQWRAIYEHTRSKGGADAALSAATAAEGGQTVPDDVLIETGLDMELIPTGLSQAPVNMTVVGSPEQWALRFLAGPATMHQSAADGALEVRCGWAVVETA